VVDVFLRGNAAALLATAFLVAGAVALLLTPREEEPQIVVPMADVHVRAPGLPVEEIERQVATRLEKLLAQIDGVEDVYSMSLPGRAVLTVRFFVGEDREDSLVKIYNKVFSNVDRVPPAVESWVVKPIEIDDVPILVATLWSDRPEQIDDFALRRIAEEVEIELQAVPGTNRTELFGGRPRAVRVEVRPEALAARQTSALEVAWALGVSNVRRPAGAFDRGDQSYLVETDGFVGGLDELGDLVVNVVDGAPVFLEDVATILDGPDERASHTWLALGAADGETGAPGSWWPAVHVSVAKQKGTNAVATAERIEERLDALAARHLPEGVQVRVTRNQGETANEKVNELLESLAVAVLIVVALIAWSLGWREAAVVTVAVPVTFGLTLLLNLAVGYTINRVTLFALILSLGLVVDDPIVDVENIYRHLRLGREPPLAAVRRAVNEVRPPILYATLAVIVSFLPMLFITGMMGPYMRPMAFNVPLAMAMSMVVAFTITPWLSYVALRNHARRRTVEAADERESPFERLYAAVLVPFLGDRRRAWRLLGAVALLLLGSFALAALRWVPLKMLPFDNKNELQLVVDLPEGTTLERTDAVLRRLGAEIAAAPEVRDVSLYAGLASPMDFNGLVRHYFLRSGPQLGELRVNLLPKRRREMQSHEIALRLRPRLEALAAEGGAKIALVEVPPGPPVLSTLVAEVTGEAGVPYARLREGALALAARLTREPGVSDVDTSVEAEQARIAWLPDQEKAALSGVSREDVAATLALALDGATAGQLHLPDEVNPLPIRLRVARSERSSLEDLRGLVVKGRPGVAKRREAGGLVDAPVPFVPVAELARSEERPAERAIYHKNLRRVAYVYAEAVGRAPAEVIADVASDRREAGADPGAGAAPRSLAWRSYLWSGGGDAWSLPPGVEAVWNGEGEWKITLDVFRDLGIAFAVALVGIYGLLVVQTGSYAMPGILMISIPLTVIGILPGFWLLNALGTAPVGAYENPVFFTATAMIGMIALSGIAVRNAILLIEFVHEALRAGAPLREALLRAGAVRTRPILLTAGTALLSAVPITLDPIFSGLAWALIFGLVVSTAFTLLVVPVTYDLVYRDRPGHGVTDLAAKEPT
jgi:multidrug efflux pump subunit AcrB